MAFTGTDGAERGGLFTARLAAAVRGWLNDHSDTSRAQRAAGRGVPHPRRQRGALYVSQVLFARWMGSFEFGVYVYVWTWVLLLGGLVDLGIATGAQRFIPEYTGKKQFDMLRGFLSGSRWLVLAMATAWAALAALGVWLFGAHLHAYEIMPLYIACVGLPLFTLGRLQDGIARSYDWINLALMPPYVIRSLLLIGAMGAAYWLKLPTDASTAMLAAVATTWVHGDRPDLAMNRRFGKKIEPGPKAYGRARGSPPRCRSSWWKASTCCSRMPTCCCCGSIARPKRSRCITRRRRRWRWWRSCRSRCRPRPRTSFPNITSPATRRSFPRSSPTRSSGRSGPRSAATVIILALGKPILWLFGPQFVDGYVLMFILAIGPLARATVGPVERLLNMVGEQRACAVVYASAFATNIVLCVVLIPLFGVAGAAVAISGAMILEAVLLYARREAAPRAARVHLAAEKPRSEMTARRRRADRAGARARGRSAAPRRGGPHRMEAARRA